MNDLTEQVCEACRIDAPRVSSSELSAMLEQIPQWAVVKEEGVSQLQRAYQFPSFVAALDFTNQVGALAEKEDHHPALLTEWGRVTIRWWTHKIKGLHKNDFICAAKTDVLYASRQD
ncbi:MAG: 4a-hydroxytetrahydrobiopterin dehydratase [Pseudomonadales bacterium]